LDVKPTHTLADLCLNATVMDRTVFERSLTRHQSGVHLLAPPRNLAEIARITPQGVRQALTIARTLYPFVVVDLDDCFHEEQTQALRMADLILLVFRLDFTSLRNTRRIIDHLNQLGIHQERVRIIVNRYGQAKELPSGKAEEALGVKIFHYIPEDPKTVNRANNNGIPAVLDSPKASVSKSLAKLALEVKSLVCAR
jgi:pilus assembly protein CpaE